MFLKTLDNVKVAYDFYPSASSEQAQPKGYVVLVHMMPATKESWTDFAKNLQENGYTSIAIDLRGHGQSDGGPNDYLNFSNEEHGKGKLDIEAVIEFLRLRAVPIEKIYLIGASIGANLSLAHLSANPKFKKAVLLSAGTNYYGLRADELIRRLKPDQKVLLVTAKDDVRSGGNNAEMNQKLKELAPKNSELIIYETGGHGTDLFKTHPELFDYILKFLSP